MLSIHRIFHPFKVSDLGKMVSIVTKLNTKGTREGGPNIVVVPSLTFVVVSPLGVLIPLVLVAPSRLVLLGLVLVSSWSRIIIVPIFSFIFGIVRLMGWICHVQLFKILILLNGRGLKKINPNVWWSLWWSHRLWGAKKWKVQIMLRQCSIQYIGGCGAFTSA
jgi:hypothetical protein